MEGKRSWFHFGMFKKGHEGSVLLRVLAHESHGGWGLALAHRGAGSASPSVGLAHQLTCQATWSAWRGKGWGKTR